MRVVVGRKLIAECITDEGEEILCLKQYALGQRLWWPIRIYVETSHIKGLNCY